MHRPWQTSRWPPPPIDGDAAIANNSSDHLATSHAAAAFEVTQQVYNGDRRKKIKNTVGGPAPHPVAATPPRPAPKGKQICKMYNRGSCVSLPDGSCSSDPVNRIHKCSTCNKYGHPAGDCPSQSKGAGKAKAKTGKGKGRGKNANDKKKKGKK